MGFCGGSVVNCLPMQETWVRSLGWEDPLEEGGNPLQYSYLGNSMGRGAWQAAVHGVRKESDMTYQLKTTSCLHICSVTKSCLTPCDPMNCIMLGFLVLHYLPEFAQIWSHPTISSSVSLFFLLVPSNFSSIRVFFNELALGIRWLKYWSFSFSSSPSNECLGLISS